MSQDAATCGEGLLQDCRCGTSTDHDQQVPVDLCDRRPKWLSFLPFALCDALNLYCGSGSIPLLLNSVLRSQCIDSFEQRVLVAKSRVGFRNPCRLAACIDLELDTVLSESPLLFDTCPSSIVS
jgi:hypothetical protein